MTAHPMTDEADDETMCFSVRHGRLKDLCIKLEDDNARLRAELEQALAAVKDAAYGNVWAMRCEDWRIKHTAIVSVANKERYWLIERGSPAEWWVRGTGRGDGTMLHEEWTRDAFKAQRFNELGAAKYAKELELWGVRGPLRATEHIECPEPPTIIALVAQGEKP